MQEKNNIRLDEYLVIKNYFDSRTKSKQSIERGEVYIDGVNVIKPSFSINLSKEIVVEIKASESFVSLGGYKLQKALKDFNFSVENYVVADIGCSYGGFTDCLLQNKARKVFAVDVTDDILHKSLKDSEKVVFINKNAKYLSKEDFNEKIDLLVCDLSFISISMVINTFSKILEDGSYCILLIKPQFEVGKRVKFKNGIITDKKIQEKACRDVIDYAKEFGFTPLKLTQAPIQNGKNIEFLTLLKKGSFTNSEFEFFY